ncbi:DNA polymerase III subunit gamma and tau [Streptomyces sp. TS71-3]|uniref:DNA polymerase III subunit gamma and tau n=1 Tax=Streptomyces sp. TS71-3 TaxID=2733862 RepID=UPI001BB373C6|nr:DNA polymerase III subunit gamma and tau [Streptomyces sp. TS71-3]
MSSLALYRRYRPESFAEVIGQEHVTDPLQQALRNNRVNHAYLFSGPRGCGKTTSARILARCLNCEQGPTPTPCGECRSCLDLARNGPGSIDVIEIDAASHGGVDDARDLREKAFFGPAASRYKIYIIDEAHMVTSAGFNALLKVVEEPPEHLKFIFATTEPEKVIGTIRSRTHHYPFRLVPPGTLRDYLADVCGREKIPVADGVLPLVVRAGAGSVRDSMSVMDQLLAGAAEDGVTYAMATGLLGYTDGSLLDSVVEAFATGDGAAAFEVVDRVVEAGNDPRRFVADLLERLRDLVILAAVPDAAEKGLIDAPADVVERMQAQAGSFGAAELSRAADLVNEGLTEMRGATAPRLQLELICARVLLPAAYDDERSVLARLDRVERGVQVQVMHGGPGGSGGPGGGGYPAMGYVPESDAHGPGVGQGGSGAIGGPGSGAGGGPGAGSGAGGPGGGGPAAGGGASAARAAARAGAGGAPGAAGATGATGAPETAGAGAPGSDRGAGGAAQAGGGGEAGGSGAGGQGEGDPAAGSGSGRGGPGAWPEATAKRTDGGSGPGGAGGSGTGSGTGSGAGAEGAGGAAAGQGAGGSDTPARRPGGWPTAASTGGGARPAGAPSGSASSSTSGAAEASGWGSRSAGGSGSGAPAGGAQGSPPSGGGGGGLDPRVLWPNILEAVKNRRRFTWILLSQNAHVAGFDGTTLQIGFVNAGARDNFAGSGSEDVLRQALAEQFGVQWNIEAIVDPSGGSAPPGGMGGPGGPQGGRAPAQPAPPSRPGPARPGPGSAPGAEGQGPGAGPGASGGYSSGSDSGTSPGSPRSSNGQSRPSGGASPSGPSRPASAGAAEPAPSWSADPGTPAPISPEDDIPEDDDPDLDESALSSHDLIVRELGATVLEEYATE